MTKLRDLVESGKLAPGTKLYRKRKGQIIEATITEHGLIQLADGSLHKTPSGAAKVYTDGKSVDGWLFWRVASLAGVQLRSFMS